MVLLEGGMLETWIGSEATKLLADALAGKWRKHGVVHDKVELHKRRVLSSRISQNIYRELHSLRLIFIEHNLMTKHDTNRKFFDKWLTDPIVEMGWSPSGAWTQQRIAALRTDLEGVRA
jgi:hypothetical protein